MKISIITVVYNAVYTIERTIQSVLNQNYDELEYIVIDGGSSDGTVDVIRKYESDISYWISEPDGGIYNAMNKGIDIATGEVVAFLNSDDWYQKNALNCVAENFKTDVEILAGRVIFHDGNIQRVQKVVRDPDELRIKMIYCHQGIFARKELFNRYGKFDERYKMAADYDWLLRIYNQGISIRDTDIILAHFSCSGISSSQTFLTHIEIREIALSYLEELEKGSDVDKSETDNIRKSIFKEHDKFEKNSLFKRFLQEKQFGKAQVNNRVKDLFVREKKYSIFGCGKAGKECYEFLDQIGLPPDCFWDNGESKWGIYCNGIIVKDPKDIKKSGALVIIASTYYEDEIKGQLNAMGLSEYIDYICYSEIRYEVGRIIAEYAQHN